MKYLGLLLRDTMTKRGDWMHLLQRFENKIKGWMCKLLSFGGRLVLINSVITHIPIFFFSYFWAPTWFVKRVDSLRRSFLWKGKKEVSGSLCLLSWKKVCKQRTQGDLAVMDLHEFNIALLGKWWW